MRIDRARVQQIVGRYALLLPLVGVGMLIGRTIARGTMPGSDIAEDLLIGIGGAIGIILFQELIETPRRNR